MELIFKDFNIWLQGMLFVLAIYHIGASIFTKDKSFVLYAIYLLLVLIYLIPKSQSQTSLYLTAHFKEFFNTFNWIIQFWFWMFYTWFSILFLNLKEKNKRLTKISYLWIQTVTITSIIFFFIDVIFFEGKYLSILFSFIYTPISFIFIIYFLINAFKYKDPLNKFYLLGLLSYLVFALIALYYSIFKKETDGMIISPISFFMIGVFLEAIILSIGLGYKYHLYRRERDNYNTKLIKELQKNQSLTNQLNEQLSEKVEETSIELQTISKQAEIYKIKQLEIHYKNQINELKLSSLLNQMNPHFIFNALNSIKLFIINNEQKKAAHYLNKFSKLIRRILEASKTKSVSLEKELETMELYMTLENIRFSNEIVFILNISKTLNTENIEVPPLILQPFIEKAIWDGLSSKKGDKKITLSVNQTHKDFIEIIIEDNGIGREASAKIKAEKTIHRKSIGIALTKDRLKNFVKNSKNSFQLTYSDLKDENGKATGTRANLYLPLF